MEIGTGIGVGSIVLSVAAIIITVLVLFKPKRKSESETTGKKTETVNGVCMLHGTLDTGLGKLETRLEKRDEEFWDAIKEIRDDIKQLIKGKRGE